MVLLKEKRNILFVVTVDTEEDNQWKWKPPAPFTFSNISHLGRFQALCDLYAVIPTYLTTYQVAKNKNSADLLRSFLGNGAEIGAHLHPWSNPPYSDFEEGSESTRKKLFPSQLSPDLFVKKLYSLTKIIKDNFDSSPTSFRAGRWGFEEAMATDLIQQGYVVDSSVSPKINWAKRLPGLVDGNLPNFSHAPSAPYKIPNSNLIEIPMTIVYTGKLIGDQSVLARYASSKQRGVLVGVYEKFISKPMWCRIYKNTTIDDLKTIFSTVVRNKIPVCQFMIHSSELIAGGSPYAKSEEDIEHTYAVLSDFFQYVREQGVVPCSLTEASKYFVDTV